MVAVLLGYADAPVVGPTDGRFVVPQAQSYYFSGKYELHQKLWLSSRPAFLVFLISLAVMVGVLYVFPYSNFANYPQSQSVSPFLYLTFLTM